MIDEDCTRQIQHLLQFIFNESKDKAMEINITAEEEYHALKLHLIQSGIDKINQEYDRKEKQLETGLKIEYSRQLNSSRLRRMQSQNDLIEAMKQETEKQLLGISQNDHFYKDLLKDLVVQCLIRLKEPAVILRCREADLTMVESVLEEAKQDYGQRHKDDVTTEICLDHRVFLPPADGGGVYCVGGVVMASKDGRIVCDNTLDSRLNIVFKQKLPQLCRILKYPVQR